VNRPKVVVTQRIHPEVAGFLGEFSEPVLNESRDVLPEPELLARCRDAQGLMVFMPDRLDATFLGHCPKLQIVAATLKGYDLDSDGFSPRITPPTRRGQGPRRAI
jgi:phosphonate dehydrogenase